MPMFPLYVKTTSSIICNITFSFKEISKLLDTNPYYPNHSGNLMTGFRARLFKEENFENCKLVVSLVETGNLALNTLMELIFLQDVEYIGYGLAHDKLTLAKMVEGMPGSTFPFYRKDDVVYLACSSPITANLSDDFSSSLVEWIIENKFSELIILGSLRMFQVETKQLRFYSKKYMDSEREVDHVQNGMAVGGTGPQLFIKSDFHKMLSQAVFMVTGESEDDVLLIPETMQEIVKILGLDVDLDKWKIGFDKEIENVDLDSEEDDFEIPRKTSDYV